MWLGPFSWHRAHSKPLFLPSFFEDATQNQFYRNVKKESRSYSFLLCSPFGSVKFELKKMNESINQWDFVRFIFFFGHSWRFQEYLSSFAWYSHARKRIDRCHKQMILSLSLSLSLSPSLPIPVLPPTFCWLCIEQTNIIINSFFLTMILCSFYFSSFLTL